MWLAHVPGITVGGKQNINRRTPPPALALIKVLPPESDGFSLTLLCCFCVGIWWSTGPTITCWDGIHTVYMVLALFRSGFNFRPSLQQVLVSNKLVVGYCN